MHQQNNRHYNDAVGQRQRDSTLVAYFQQKLQQLPLVTPDCSIYRLPRRLCDINPTAYTPQLISIGPFHHGRKDLMAMEQHKLCCLGNYLRRVNMKIEEAVEKARKWERNALNYYAEPIAMNSDDFVQMMLVDGCFIVELMIIASGVLPQTQNELNLSFYKAISIDLYRDLTMLENQLPFFVLRSLLEPLSPMVGVVSLEKVAHMFFCNGLIKPCALPPDDSTQKVKHLVHFLSFNFVPSPGTEEYMGQKLKLPPTATELYEAGVVFKKATEVNKHKMDISFKNGVLEIPPFEIHDAFETYLRNVMAFEHFSVGNQSYAIHYVAFLDGLISTEKDVHLLVKAKIITNHIGGSDEEVKKLFNDLCKDITIAGDFYFYSLSKSLRNHCKARRNKWKASLRRDYFNTPWALISFFAAALLILLTSLQTLFSGLSLSNG